jgi:hypothetical protein
VIHERYSIEVSNDCVQIYGYLTIEETFDFLNFYERKGYKCVSPGYENSTLMLLKKDEDDRQQERQIQEEKESELMYEKLYSDLKNDETKLKNKIKELESFIMRCFSEESEKVKFLKAENEVLMRSLKIKRMENNEEVKKLLDGFSYKKPEESDGLAETE